MRLFVTEILDSYIRENFRLLLRVFLENPFLKGQWKFHEITVSGAFINYRYPHKLNFVPKDVFQSSVIGAGAVTWNYSLFDSTYLDLTTTGSCTIRVIVGTVGE